MRKRNKPVVGLTGSLLLLGWGIYRLNTAVSFTSYDWIIPFIFLVSGGIGTIANLFLVIRGRLYASE